MSWNRSRTSVPFTSEPTRRTPQFSTPSNRTTGADATPVEEEDNFDRVASMARDAYRIGKELLGELNVEYKRIQTSIVGHQPAWNNAGTPSLLLNSCTQGDTGDTRNGDQIKMTRITGRGILRTSVATFAAYSCRVILYYTPGADVIINRFPTAVGAIDGLLDFAQTGTVNAPHAPKDPDCSRQTKILWDKHFELEGITSDAQEIIEFSIPLNKHTVYENNSATINNGSLRLMAVCDSAASAFFVLNMVVNVYFVDN